MKVRDLFTWLLRWWHSPAVEVVVPPLVEATLAFTHERAATLAYTYARAATLAYTYARAATLAF